ncbi:hypothetical protein ACFPRL_32480 [Pseudoclavibacter helvolus]
MPGPSQVLGEGTQRSELCGENGGYGQRVVGLHAVQRSPEMRPRCVARMNVSGRKK